MMESVTLGPLIPSLEGLALEEQEYELLRHPAVGGAILFAHNFAADSEEQLFQDSSRAQQGGGSLSKTPEKKRGEPVIENS